MADNTETLLDDGVPVSPVCGFCVRLQDAFDKTCEAFPKGISMEIWNGDNLHKKSITGDNGLLFKFDV